MAKLALAGPPKLKSAILTMLSGATATVVSSAKSSCSLPVASVLTWSSLYSGSFSLRGARAFPRCTKAPGVTAMTRAASAGWEDAAKPGTARSRLRQQNAAQKKRRWINIHASVKEKSVEHVRFKGRNGNKPTLLEQVTIEMSELLRWPCKRTPKPKCKPRFSVAVGIHMARRPANG